MNIISVGYQPFRTRTIEKAIGIEPNIIRHGVLHISDDYSMYDEPTRDLFNRLATVGKMTTYEEKLEYTISNKICITQICCCDITDVIEFPDTVKIDAGKKVPDLKTVFDLTPSNPVELLQLNLKNIETALNQIGSFDKYKESTLNFLDKNRDSIFFIEWLERQIKQAENECSKSQYDFGSMYTGVGYWYNAFDGKKESLKLNDYRIWLTEISKPTLLRDKPFDEAIPKMCYLLDNPEIIINAAKGFLYTRIIPFLKSTKEAYLSELYPEISQEYIQLEISENLPAVQQAISEPIEVKKGRKGGELTHKQQMVLAEYFGIISHPILTGHNLKPEQKGNILGALLNHGVDDTKNMLNPKTSKSSPKLDWNTDFERGKVKAFLQKNGIDLDKL